MEKVSKVESIRAVVEQGEQQDAVSRRAFVEPAIREEASLEGVTLQSGSPV